MDFTSRLRAEAPSLVETPFANNLRKICIKYLVFRLANDLMKRSKDLDFCPYDEFQRITMKALSWTSDTEQKNASREFMKFYREAYESSDMAHLVFDDFHCMNFLS
ncbi:unnamed protein product [Gongylonema pulchrum]|uniref:Uncharacterized protein n=1 Tax=Gongylonema pulchrum TaxID=637853 RepID=A0A3P6Q9J7_9BILA|nr:unnamed protein product [Gongylonema pulchrum]